MQPGDNDIIYSEYGVDLLGLIQYLLEGVFGFGFTSDGIGHFLVTVWDILSLIAFLMSFLFIIGIIYSYLRINEYLALNAKKLALDEATWLEIHGGAKGHNARWAEVLRHVASAQPNDWKLAIIEADIMLGDFLKERGYAGQSIGDQLKSIPPMQMSSLQDAWDAHRIRNRIAHEGSDFVLTHSLSQEAIVKYERALRELGLV
ncbi:MAG: hypothetical protein AUK16_00015 [Parcubacteria group bacterium CG2_30_44_11]|nr:MAG: hypothetical protein AUK16_00015 [Parcubacteria group bacterium CG2_30_44_11]